MNLRASFRGELNNGGLLLATTRPHSVGDEVFIRLRLLRPEGDRDTLRPGIDWTSTADGDVGVGISLRAERGRASRGSDEEIPVAARVVSVGELGPADEASVVVEFSPIDGGGTRRRIERILDGSAR